MSPSSGASEVKHPPSPSAKAGGFLRPESWAGPRGEGRGAGGRGLMDGRAYQQDGEVLQHAVHHVLLGQVLELVDEVDHVLAHGRPAYPVHEAAVLKPRILRLCVETAD